MEIDREKVLRPVASSDANYLYREGLELSHSGKYGLAIDLLNKALSIRPQFPVAWYQRGVCLDQLDKREEALTSYDTCISHDPYHADAWFNRGMVLKKLGRHDEGDLSVLKALDLCCGR
jgi:tetratricopeptide (TPR) repeat protein